jgi:hypothetical protein
MPAAQPQCTPLSLTSDTLFRPIENNMLSFRAALRPSSGSGSDDDRDDVATTTTATTTDDNALSTPNRPRNLKRSRTMPQEIDDSNKRQKVSSLARSLSLSLLLCIGYIMPEAGLHSPMPFQFYTERSSSRGEKASCVL